MSRAEFVCTQATRKVPVIAQVSRRDRASGSRSPARSRAASSSEPPTWRSVDENLRHRPGARRDASPSRRGRQRPRSTSISRERDPLFCQQGLGPVAIGAKRASYRCRRRASAAFLCGQHVPRRYSGLPRSIRRRWLAHGAGEGEHADPGGAGASSAATQPSTVAPVVITSSTRTTERPARRRARAGRDGEDAGDVAGARRAPIARIFSVRRVAG